jgi:hypothetical protein
MTNVTTGSLPLPAEQRRQTFSNRFIVIQSIIAAILSGVFLIWAIINSQNSLFLLSGSLAFVAIVGIILRYQFGNLNVNIRLLIASTLLLLCLILVSASFSDVLIPVAVFCFLYSFLFASGLMTGIY